MEWESAEWVLSGGAEEEEAYMPPRHEDAGRDGTAVNLPVLLLSLSAMAEQLDDGADARTDLGKLREAVLGRLAANFASASAQLFDAGICEHSESSHSDEDRAAAEEASGGAVVTVVQYPAHFDGAPTDALWAMVCAGSEWEVVAELKHHIRHSARDLRWKADICNEIENLAETAAHAMSQPGATHLGADPRAEASVWAAGGEGGEWEADGAAPSALDLLLDLIFSRPAIALSGRLADKLAERAAAAEARASLRRMWLSTFGPASLPPASSVALKHAPVTADAPRPAPDVASAYRPPRMRVPPPPHVRAGPISSRFAGLSVSRSGPRGVH